MIYDMCFFVKTIEINKINKIIVVNTDIVYYIFYTLVIKNPINFYIVFSVCFMFHFFILNRSLQILISSFLIDLSMNGLNLMNVRNKQLKKLTLGWSLYQPRKKMTLFLIFFSKRVNLMVYLSTGNRNIFYIGFKLTNTRREVVMCIYE
ncbi:LOW QUALITY PROTEIN: hypothetical protein KUTeg_012199 [Tegillarca granosa]|uniref:Uncharacterized protein n=1 Tax=Tegillarca granosa TaxID=220873 RepID=A0ABQ9EZ17_TEGGR|nr:LOW QUALITY PROTEIN: hypothetical protein KUTeg_012199 [Tegillarca granosa]